MQVRNEATFLAAANLVGERIGVPLDPVDPVTIDRHNFAVMLPSIDGQSWVHIRSEPPRHNTNPRQLTPYNAPATLRGLLRHSQGLFEIAVDHSESQLVRVDVVSSPDAINEAQVQLGRQPGIDAFRLTPYENEIADDQAVRAGAVVEGVANLEMRIATPDRPYWSWHDLKPNPHAFGWVGMPAKICLGAQAGAAAIVSKYGDKIHAPDNERPAEVINFVSALDGWGTSVGPLFAAVSGIDHTGFRPDEVTASLEKVAHIVSAREGYIDSRAIETYNLKPLGIIEAGASREEMHEIVLAARRETVAHLATLRLHLEEVRPKPRESIKARVGRMMVWSALIEQYAT